MGDTGHSGGAHACRAVCHHSWRKNDPGGKTETVAVEVNLLRADLCKVSDKVKVAKGSIVDLQAEVGTLRKQMAQVTSTVGTLEV
ncbi:hypothetical protein NDU88_006315 [Pleurodeles waltl]|uniref:Uncharacterized protein n=1 Tax=Pleurodeles waltl TaxID=8319 RepID=A0AAV7X288_PLEWA|nr:hypothetical protein NDU88_006315 [Pleurodeles waltl]